MLPNQCALVGGVHHQRVGRAAALIQRVDQAADRAVERARRPANVERQPVGQRHVQLAARFTCKDEARGRSQGWRVVEAAVRADVDGDVSEERVHALG